MDQPRGRARRGGTGLPACPTVCSQCRRLPEPVPRCTFNDKEIGASCINLKRIYAAGLGCEELQVPLQTHKVGLLRGRLRLEAGAVGMMHGGQ